MVHPTGFEPVASAFGGNIASSAENRKGPPMTADLIEIAKQYGLSLRRAYPFSRSDFRPAAYAALTRKCAAMAEGCNV